MSNTKHSSLAKIESIQNVQIILIPPVATTNKYELHNKSIALYIMEAVKTSEYVKDLPTCSNQAENNDDDNITRMMTIITDIMESECLQYCIKYYSGLPCRATYLKILAGVPLAAKWQLTKHRDT